jgi:hypothetical protein
MGQSVRTNLLYVQERGEGNKGGGGERCPPKKGRERNEPLLKEEMEWLGSTWLRLGGVLHPEGWKSQKMPQKEGVLGFLVLVLGFYLLRVGCCMMVIIEPVE